MFEGSKEAKILFVSDFLRVHEKAEQTVLAGERRSLLVSALQRAGLSEDSYAMTVIHPDMPPGCKDPERFPEEQRIQDRIRTAELINTSAANVIVPLGSYALEFITGFDSIDKQHCSILSVKAEFGKRKAIPLFHPERVQHEYGLIAYISFGCLRLKQEMHSRVLDIPARKFLLSLDLSFSQVIQYLNDVVLKASELSVDVETGSGVINTVGFAVSPTEAIAIETHPQYAHFIKTPEQFHELWKLIGQIWESRIPKIAQNALFEFQWASKYGFRLENIIFDTMWAMKFLHPELDKGLDNVGRIYTRYPYWKDDHSDWNNVRDWRSHLDYNCKDTTGAYAAKINMLKALQDRKLEKLFCDYTMRFLPVIQEMCSKGLPLDEKKLFAMRIDSERDIQAVMEQINRDCEARIGRTINIRSPQQMKTAFREMGITIPVQKGKESLDKKALEKLRRKYPKDMLIPSLLKAAKLNKESSSYLNFKYDLDKRIRYSLDGCATETHRWAGYVDPWDNGFNPQTVPSKIKKIVKADPGKILLELDLSQAESRYVAYEAPEPKLMEMLERREDVHKFVASRIFNKDPEMVNKQERQLGKKSGHSANYGVGPRTFAEACLVELGLFITETEAKRIINGYFEVFPGIRRRHANIQAEIRRTKMLRTPLGHERTFYDRIGDNVFREAYAYAPQCTIPDITNHLMLFLYDHFENVDFLLQVHDSLLLQTDPKTASKLVEASQDYEAWHPRIDLPGGRLVIPVEAKAGFWWGKMESV